MRRSPNSFGAIGCMIPKTLHRRRSGRAYAGDKKKVRSKVHTGKERRSCGFLISGIWDECSFLAVDVTFTTEEVSVGEEGGDI